VSGSGRRGPGAHPVAVLICRAGEPPLGGDEAVSEAGGDAVIAGEGADSAAAALTSARRVWTLETGRGLQVGVLSRRLAELLAASPLIVLPGSADGRDLAPRLAAALGRPLLAGAKRVGLVFSAHGEREVEAVLTRLEGRLELPVRVAVPVVATVPPGVRSAQRSATCEVIPLSAHHDAAGPAAGTPDVEVLEVIEPDPSTMDLAEAPRVVAGGAGLLPAGADDATGRAMFGLLAEVAAAMGASAGATRVITDVGWMDVDRQIGTTGITLDPDLYIAFGISGAVQHTGGIGAPTHVVSVNTDASCPMTAMATFGLVTDARALLIELAHRFGIEIPAQAGPDRDVSPDVSPDIGPDIEEVRA
jgi:electron transfer flavoprotein alpha subunit